MIRFSSRILLGVSLSIAIIIIVITLRKTEAENNAIGAVIAASLAVITSIISAWSSQRILEIQENNLKPYPYPLFDTTSRYGLVQLKVTNLGGGIAYNINLYWDESIINHKGEKIEFAHDKNAPEIPILHPNESITTLIDGHINFFKKNRKHNYSGIITYTNQSDKLKKHKFFLSAEMYRSSLTYDKEELKTHYEIQKIPNEYNGLINSDSELSDSGDRIQLY